MYVSWSDGHDGHLKGVLMDGHTNELCQSLLYWLSLKPRNRAKFQKI